MLLQVLNLSCQISISSSNRTPGSRCNSLVAQLTFQDDISRIPEQTPVQALIASIGSYLQLAVCVCVCNCTFVADLASFPGPRPAFIVCTHTHTHTAPSTPPSSSPHTSLRHAPPVRRQRSADVQVLQSLDVTQSLDITRMRRTHPPRTRLRHSRSVEEKVERRVGK